ncbi:aspartyl protease [Mycena sanguinolenta]|nr:aspartyl protease [Mycena sanguinolenta]
MCLPPNPTTSLPVLLLLFAGADLCTAVAEPIHVPISLGRRGSATVEDRRYARNLPNQRRAIVPIGGDEFNNYYYLTLSIGTPPQQFNFEIDLASPYSWVADFTCAGFECEGILELYDPSRSSSVTQISTGNSLEYGPVNVSGNFMKDAVQLTPYTVPSQFFLAANKVSADVETWPSSGIVGLAYQQTTQGSSFPMSLFSDSNGQLPSADMSFWVNRMNTADYDDDPVGGAFTFGGTNTSLYTGAIEYLPTTAPSNTTWNLDVKEVIVQGTSVQITPASAAFSFLSLNISGPASDVAAIWAAVPGAVPSTTQSGYYEFPCTTTVNVSVSFGGRLWNINPLDMNIGASELGGTQCLGAIYALNSSSSSNSTSWVFGTAFMKNVYSVFQPTPFAIGFAELSTQASSSNTSSHSTPVGTIVGVVVGILVLLAICGACGKTRRATYAVVNVPTLVRTA